MGTRWTISCRPEGNVLLVFMPAGFPVLLLCQTRTMVPVKYFYFYFYLTTLLIYSLWYWLFVRLVA